MYRIVLIVDVIVIVLGMSLRPTGWFIPLLGRFVHDSVSCGVLCIWMGLFTSVSPRKLNWRP